MWEVEEVDFGRVEICIFANRGGNRSFVSGTPHDFLGVGIAEKVCLLGIDKLSCNLQCCKVATVSATRTCVLPVMSGSRDCKTGKK